MSEGCECVFLSKIFFVLDVVVLFFLKVFGKLLWRVRLKLYVLLFNFWDLKFLNLLSFGILLEMKYVFLVRLMLLFML